jgi:hypothetical protein
MMVRAEPEMRHENLCGDQEEYQASSAPCAGPTESPVENFHKSSQPNASAGNLMAASYNAFPEGGVWAWLG